MKRRDMIVLIVSSLITALMIGSMFIFRPPDQQTYIALGSYILSFAIIMIGMWIFKRKKKLEEPVEADERTVKIQQRATTYSFWLVYFSIIALMWLDYLGLLRLPSSTILFILVLVMPYSVLVARLILRKKGDVE